MLTINRLLPLPPAPERDPWAGVSGRSEGDSMAGENDRVTVTVVEGKDHMNDAGNTVGGGGTYETTRKRAEELEKLGLVTISGGSTSSTSDSEGGKEELPEWKLKQSPQEYLAAHPDGPSAELAKRHVDAEKG